MKKQLMILLSGLLMIFTVSSISLSYDNVDSESGSNCQSCHTDWEDGTTWHNNHKSSASSCDACHSGTVVPASSCSTSGCHTDETWKGNPEYHSVIGQLDCMSCHENNGDCPLETALAGDSRITILKQFRDQVLSQNAAGRAVIDLYYFTAPVLTRALNSSPALKQLTAALVDLFLPVIEITLKK